MKIPKDESTAKRNVLRCIRICLLMLITWGFVICMLSGNHNASLCMLLAEYTVCLCYYLEKIRRRCIQLMFHITTWVFLISRPTISMLRQTKWWYFTEESISFALAALFITILFMYIGSSFCETLLEIKGVYAHEHTARFYTPVIKDRSFNDTLMKIACIAFYVTLAFSLVAGAEKLSFMSGKDYTMYYTSFKSGLPYAFQTIEGFMPYILCIYLATMPKKASAFFALVCYVVSTVPMLLIGVRNNIVLAVIFAFLYFVIRDYLDGTRRWIGTVERVCIIIAVPAAIVLLGAYNYTRAGTDYSGGGVLSLVVDFFYKQGVSFDVLNMGYNALPKLPAVVPKVYTFSTFLDYFGHNNLAVSLFGAMPLGEGNSVIMATYSNSFAHSMSYIAHPNYLGGEGWGSSYLLENYADFGYLGIVVFSLVLAAFMAAMIPIIKKYRLGRIIIFIGLTSLFLVPRAEATGWLSFIIYTRFWAAVALCYLFAAVFRKNSIPCSAYHYKYSGTINCAKKDGKAYV